MSGSLPIVGARFAGIAGHASAARALDDSAVHRAIGWGAKALGYARAWRAASKAGPPIIRANCSASALASDKLTASSTGHVRVFSATTTASIAG
mgnify:CR=1 FL=1